MVNGRPTKYDPKFCAMLIKHMGKGFSYESFAAVAKVHIDTLYEWEKVHGNFSDAKKTAIADNLHFWENQGLKGMWGDKEGPTFNSTVWIFNMKNRHKWRDRHEIDAHIDDEREKLRKMSTSELEKLVKNNLKEKDDK